MREHDDFERALQRLTPATLPEPLRRRLEATLPHRGPVCQHVPVRGPGWWRWLFPLGATALGAALLAIQLARTGLESSNAAAAMVADEVVIDQTLVSSFDTIARLSDGLPVRIRCEHWVDELVLRDSARGVSVEQSRPRLEVFPVGFETY